MNKSHLKLNKEENVKNKIIEHMILLRRSGVGKWRN